MLLNRRSLLAALPAAAALLPLRALAAPSPAAPIGFGMVNVRDFGAIGDGQTIDSPAIDRAIAAAASRGGGTVVFPPGVYASYTIHLQSHIRLYLEYGATLLAAPVPVTGTTTGGYDAAEPQDPAIEPFQDFGHNHWRNSLIYGEGLSNIAIEGEGLIWGKGLSKGPAENGLPKADLPGVGNKAIALKNCRNVVLRDFSVLKGGHFALLATGVDNLTIDNLTVDTDRDGFDIDCCKSVRVTNCRVNSPWDDAIVPKSSFALGYPRVTENVLISNCYVTGSYEVGSFLDGTFKPFQGTKAKRLGRIKLGTESNGGFRNINVANCIFDKCWGLALETVDGAILEDIAVTNLTMHDCLGAPIFLRLGSRMRGPAGTAPGKLRRISISNLVCHSATPAPAIIAGLSGTPVEDVIITGFTYAHPGGGSAADAALAVPENESHYPEPDMFGTLPASGFYIRHGKNIDISHVQIRTDAPDQRPAFFIDDVEAIGVGRLDVPSTGPAFSLKNVRGFATFANLNIPDRRLPKLTTMVF